MKEQESRWFSVFLISLVLFAFAVIAILPFIMATSCHAETIEEESTPMPCYIQEGSVNGIPVFRLISCEELHELEDKGVEEGEVEFPEVKEPEEVIIPVHEAPTTPVKEVVEPVVGIQGYETSQSSGYEGYSEGDRGVLQGNERYSRKEGKRGKRHRRSVRHCSRNKKSSRA